MERAHQTSLSYLKVHTVDFRLQLHYVMVDKKRNTGLIKVIEINSGIHLISFILVIIT